MTHTGVCTIAEGGRPIPFHVGEAALEIGGLGEALILSGRVGAFAQKGDFAEDLYRALCDTLWRDRTDSVRWGCTWRCAADIAAAVRGLLDDSYETFHQGGGEGRITDQVRAEFQRLGWSQVQESSWRDTLPHPRTRPHEPSE